MLRNVIKEIRVKCNKFGQIKVDIPQFIIIMNVHVLEKCGSLYLRTYVQLLTRM